MFFAACGDGATEPPTPDPPRPTTVTVTPATAELAALGATVQLTATVLDQHGNAIPGAQVAWSSGRPVVAAVDTTGLVTAVGNGTATVTATAGTVTGTAEVTVTGVLQPDRAALVALFEAAGGPQWTYSGNWLTDAPVGEWHGVEIDESGRVARLILRANGLSGLIPPELGDLERLRQLDLHSNALSGPVPNEIGDLTALESLYLWNNDLSGPIPPEIGNLTALDTLGLDENDLSGPIPPEIGNLTALEALWLGFNDLSGPIPPEIGNLTTLETLGLDENDLSGPIPPEIGNLTALEALWLRANDLNGSIPPEIGNLTALEELSLGFNDLSGPIPPEIGNLTALEILGLDENDLSGPIPPEIGNLTALEELSLGFNDLSGPIPPEIGNLTALVWLYLYYNELSGPIPPEIGNLTALEELSFSFNDLSGPIPAEIGNLTSVEALVLRRNALTGSVPPELGRLSALRDLSVAWNTGLRGALPRELTALALEAFSTAGTELCAPADAHFRAWLASVTAWAPFCTVGRTHAYLVQAVQSARTPVTLVANEPALLRVFVAADSGASASFPAVRARFFADGRELHAVSIPGSSRPLPTAANQTEGSLAHSANALIPASVLVPGLEVEVEIDPEGRLPSGIGVPGRWPAEGRRAMDVGRVPPLDLTLVPFLLEQDPARLRGLADRVKELTADDELFRLTRDVLPVEAFNVTAHEPVWTSIVPNVDNSSEILSEVWALRTIEGGTGHYMGVLEGGGGAGDLGGWVIASSLGGREIAHELGHNMGLLHAPCGDPAYADDNYPYSNGSIGSWGYDFEAEDLVPPSRPDLMSYCRPDAWVSDYFFNKALGFRENLDTAPGATAAVRSLLLWGRTDPDGVPVLEPAFVVHAPPSAPRDDGPFRLAGLTFGGDTLFALSFAAEEVADGEGGSAFAFALPVEDAWSVALDRIVLLGPGGSDEVEQVPADGGAGAANRATVLLLDEATGRPRGFLRRASAVAQAELAVGTTGSVSRLPGPGLEALVSRGIPDATAWRR